MILSLLNTIIDKGRSGVIVVYAPSQVSFTFFEAVGFLMMEGIGVACRKPHTFIHKE